MQPTIYVCHDLYVDDELGEAAAELSRKGWRVVRGPQIVAGTRHRFSPEQRRDLLVDADVIVVTSRTQLNAEDMAAARRLRAVICPTIGVDAVDLDACEKQGIIVGHGATPENFLSMAEATVMLMLVLLYDLRGTERVLRENLPRPVKMRARMLRGRTIGLIGFGRIGRGVLERLHNWHARILVHDPFIAGDAVPREARLVGFDQLLSESDLVSLHLPLDTTTRHLIGERQLRMMKPNAILLNTARGGLVDEEALVRVMEEGHLDGVGLDTFETEPLPADSPLRRLDRAVLTPHMLGHTVDLYGAIVGTLVENVTRVMRGDPPVYTKNPGVADAWSARLAAVE